MAPDRDDDQRPSENHLTGYRVAVLTSIPLVRDADEGAVDEAMSRRAHSMGASYGGCAPSDVPLTFLQRRGTAA